MTNNRSRHLVTALASNATFTGLCALLLLASPEAFSSAFGSAPLWLLRSVGAALAGYVPFLTLAIQGARRPEPRPGLALAAVVLDLGWVLGAVAMTPLVLTGFSDVGAAVFWGVAAMVLLFAVGQWRGIDRLYAEPRRDLGTTHRLTISTTLDVPPKLLWPVLANLGTIDQHLDSLVSARLEGQPGQGAVRTCANDKGQSWSEEVTGWQPERTIDLRFHSDAPDFPFPMHPMRGGWTLEPANRGTRLTVWWRFTPRPRWLAPLLVTALAFKARPDMLFSMRSMAKKARSAPPPEEAMA